MEEKEILKKLKQRYSCKNFDETKKVSEEDIKEMIEIFRLSPSMLNIQPWKIFIISEKNLKKELQKYASDQKQVWENSHLIVFARKISFDKKYFEKLSIWTKNKEIYENNIEKFLKKFSEDNLKNWAETQVSIALWNVINFLTLKNINSCAIWVFDRKKFDEILNLTEKWYSSVFNLCIWYEKEKKSFIIKNRLKSEEIAEFI